MLRLRSSWALPMLGVCSSLSLLAPRLVHSGLPDDACACASTIVARHDMRSMLGAPCIFGSATQLAVRVWTRHAFVRSRLAAPCARSSEADRAVRSLHTNACIIATLAAQDVYTPSARGAATHLQRCVALRQVVMMMIKAFAESASTSGKFNTCIKGKLKKQRRQRLCTAQVAGAGLA